MHDYHNILYVTQGATNEVEGLKQALSLARNNKAVLKILLVSPEFPKEMEEYKEKYHSLLIEQVEESVRLAKDALTPGGEDVDVSIALEYSKTPSICIIQQVLQGAHDLVIKEAPGRKNGEGLKALDMDLLRKCPCPVWLCRPIMHSRKDIKVAVAIDPESQEPIADELSKRMLQLARSLADSCNSTLEIVSCWDYEFEEYLRGNVWLKVSDDMIEDALLRTRTEHHAKLEKLIAAADISGACQIYHLRGKADTLIPSFVNDNDINILVMGTVARTGIPGFIIGNTAENIVQKLSCSLLALKPQGFASPVKAY